MCNNRECARYFKNEPAYRRCFLELRKKWKSYGKSAGQITLRDTSEEERRAIGGIVGKRFDEKEIRFSAAEFEQGLQRTRFAPVDLKQVLEAYFGETLSTNKGEKQEQQKKKREFLEGLCEAFSEPAGSGAGVCGSVVSRWIREMSSEKRYGYQLLMREFEKDPAQAERLARNVGNAVRKLGPAASGAEVQAGTEEEWPLAVFAAEISGNPHYFDRGTAAGQLLIHALSYGKQEKLPESAHQWRELLVSVGIVPDNVSSMLHAYGLRLRMKDGWHPAFDAFCARKEPYVITMENIREVTGVQAVGNCVYVVENEMVFSSLLSRAKEQNLTLLCTSGQLRAAALELIRRILAAGTVLYYSGDIDPDGMGIADRLWQKFGDGIRIWRMAPEDYEKSLSEESIGDLGMAKLEHLKNPLLQETARHVKKQKRAAYQENILEDLLEDIKGAAGNAEVNVMGLLDDYMKMNFRMEIVEDIDEGGFVVSYPDLPGCITCGETIESAFTNAMDAKKAWLEAAIEEGIEIHEPDSLEEYSGQFKLRIPRSLHRGRPQNP